VEAVAPGGLALSFRKAYTACNAATFFRRKAELFRSADLEVRLTNSDWISLASATATFLGVVVALLAIWWQLSSLKKQMTLQHFSDYTKRYQEIVQRFPEDINEQAFQLVGRKDYDQTMRAMRTYFDLCFEEWYLHKRQFIDSRVWEIWRDGMKTALSKAAFKQAWSKIQSDTKYGTEFESFVAMFNPNDATTTKPMNPSGLSGVS
jgi:hypothetical protein